jgi:hypothetical protein
VNDARHLSPHPASFSINSCAFSCCADVLAWKPARYNVNNSSPGMSVKGSYVIPNWESFEKPVILSGAQYACWVRFPLNGTDCSPAKQLSGKYASTSACEKSQLI